MRSYVISKRFGRHHSRSYSMRGEKSAMHTKLKSEGLIDIDGGIK